MKIGILWLNDYLESPVTPDEAAHLLTMAGLEVEDIEGEGDAAVLTTEVTTNRPDWLSILGTARDLAAVRGGGLRYPSTDLPEGTGDVNDFATLEVHDHDLCPRYTGRVIRGVKVGPSPEWLQRRLESIGQIPRNNVVDITNFVMFETGQPLHAFDLAKLKGPGIVVRRAREDETLVSLEGAEGKTYRLDNSVLAICDTESPVAIGGIKGGLNSGVDAGTTDLLLESAAFTPINIRHTSRRLPLATESSYRFERGVDPRMTDWASRRAAALLLELCGGELVAGVLDSNPDFVGPAPELELRHSRIRRILGIDVPPARTREILERLEFGAEPIDDDRLKVTVPTHRQDDCTREIDLIEEVARIHGYDKVPDAPAMTIVAAPDRTVDRVSEKARRLLVGQGVHEALTVSMVSHKQATQFDGWTSAEPLALKNPLTPDTTTMRTSLVPSLLEVLRTNRNKGNAARRFFELARVFLPKEGGDLPEQPLVLGLVMDDWRDARGVVDELARQWGLAGRLSAAPQDYSFAEKGHAVALALDDRPVGYVASVASTLLKPLDLEDETIAVELNIDALSQAANLTPRMTELPKFPPVARDLAIVVDEPTRWADIESTVRSAAPSTLTAIDFFDEYRGKSIEKGKKSLAFSLTFRSPDRTLVGDEVDAAVGEIVEALKKRHGAELRG